MSDPWRIHEDEELCAVNKPAGVVTHRARPGGQAGLHEWLCARTKTRLAIHHRLDKGTSGVLVFGKTRAANQRLAAAFSERRLEKRYLLLRRSDPGRPSQERCDAALPGGKRRRTAERPARTDFVRIERGAGWDLWEARPRTGRTHQIRLHAARLGAPILGDGEYSGAPAARLFLHAHSLELPGRPRLEAPLPQAFREVLAGRSPTDPGLAALAAREARELLFDSAETNAYLWIDREHDGFPGLRVERLGDVGLLLRYDESPSELPRRWLDALRRVGGLRALVEQRRPRRGPRSGFRLLRGELPAPRFWVREHGLEYLVDLSPEGCSTGFFLDQRETRRRLLGEDLSGRNVLNVFAHTGSLSVAAACAGARTVTLDLSRSYLDWARENMRRNAIDPGEHDFVHGDALDWLRRFHKKGRRFDLVLCDPPSFATGRGRRGKKTWSIERDLPLLVERAARLLAPEGRLLVSTNLRRLRWERFEERIRAGLAAADRTGALESDSLPLDFRSGPADAPYLKLAWIRIDGRGPALALGRSAHRV